MISEFFYKLLRTKKPPETAEEKEKFIFVLKYLVGYSYCNIVGEYHNFIHEITKYYPFSLLYRNRLFHAANKPYSDFMWAIQGTAREKGMNIRVWEGQDFGDTAEFYGTFRKKGLNKDSAKVNLEKILQEKFGTVYVRDNSKGFKIIVPMSLIVQS